MTDTVYDVRWTETALRLLTSISDLRIRRLIHKRAGELTHDPEKQGKPLVGELSEFRSVRAVGQTHLVVYRVEKQDVMVAVVAVGRRKHGRARDMYALAQKLLRQGLLR